MLIYCISSTSGLVGRYLFLLDVSSPLLDWEVELVITSAVVLVLVLALALVLVVLELALGLVGTHAGGTGDSAVT